MKNGLSRIFDFQKFEKNTHLEKIIKDTNSRYSLDDSSVSDDNLDIIWAAGDINSGLLEDEDDGNK